MTALALRAAPYRRGSVAGTSTRCVAALALALAALAHGLAVVEHRDPVAAAFFVGAAVVQAGLAAAYLLRPSRRLRLVMSITTTALLGVWVVSRTVGVPIGHAHGPEAVGVLDATAVVAQTIALIAIAVAPGRRGQRRLRLSLAVALSVAMAATAAYAASRPAVAHHGSDHSATVPAKDVGPVLPAGQHPPSPGTSTGTTAPERHAAHAAGPAPAHTHDACDKRACEPHAHP